MLEDRVSELKGAGVVGLDRRMYLETLGELSRKIWEASNGFETMVKLTHKSSMDSPAHL